MRALMSGTTISGLHVLMNGAGEVASTSQQILPKSGVWLWNVLYLYEKLGVIMPQLERLECS